MPSIKLTRRSVDDLTYTEKGQMFVRDADLRGFGLRVGKRSKTYFVERVVQGRTVRTSIGDAALMIPDAARRIAQARLAEMANGIDPNRAKKLVAANADTLAQAFKAYIAARPGLSASTVDNYRRTINVYLAAYSALHLIGVTPAFVMREHQRITAAHGAITANCAMRHLRLVYNWASAVRDDLPPNPVAVLTKANAWAPERRRQTVIKASRLATWWSAVAQEPDHARDYLHIALLTGMRRREVATLRWEHIDLGDRTLHIPRTKNGDPLNLPLSNFLVTLLTRRQELVRPSPWVFPGTGRSGHMAETKSFVRRVAKRSGVSFTLHDLRRTFITIAESLDIPAYALKRLLNHRASTDVTGGYIVMDVERLRGPVDRIAERVRALVDGKEEEADRNRAA